MSRQIQRPPRPTTSKAIWMGVWKETRAVHTCLSPSLVNYWTGRHTPPLSLALGELLMHGAVQWPHLERAAPLLKPGLKCGLAPLNGRHARKHRSIRTHLTWNPENAATATLCCLSAHLHITFHTSNSQVKLRGMCGTRGRFNIRSTQKQVKGNKKREKEIGDSWDNLLEIKNVLSHLS